MKKLITLITLITLFACQNVPNYRYIIIDDPCTPTGLVIDEYIANQGDRIVTVQTNMGIKKIVMDSNLKVSQGDSIVRSH